MDGARRDAMVAEIGARRLPIDSVTGSPAGPADEAATRALVGPLGIRGVTWTRAPEGVTSGGFGLSMTPGDLAKLGFLHLHRGRCDGRQVVPGDGVTASTTDRVAPPLEYGYLWWLGRADGHAFMAGLLGQLAVVAPRQDLVAVVTAHIPADVDAGSVPRWLVERHVLPAVRD
ncbi:MAG: hypothetical protein AB7O78_05095 [Thermoleophilia bacterium]